VKAFEDFLEGDIGIMLRGEGEQGTAQEGQVGQSAGVVRAGPVLAPEMVPAPVITDLDSGPVSADEVVPVLRSSFGRLLAGEIKPGLAGRLAGLGEVNLAAYHDDAAGPGKAGGIRFYGEDVEAALLGAAVSLAVLDKKGVSARASKASACLSREGWLLLI